MRLLVPRLASPIVPGCGPGLVGEAFSGECMLFDLGINPSPMPLAVEIVRDHGGDLFEEGRNDCKRELFLGEPGGELAGDDAVGELAVVRGGYTMTMFIDAELDGDDDLEGNGAFPESEGDSEASG